MPRYYSRHWNEELGVCLLHGVPETPCPACMSSKQEDVLVMFTHEDREMCIDAEIPLCDLLPSGSDWLLDRII